MMIIIINITDLKSWTDGCNVPWMPPQSWLQEQNPLFQSLANLCAHDKNVAVRIITTGPQLPLVPGMCNMWEWLVLLDAKVSFLPPQVVAIGGTVIMLDGGDKILITTMDSSKESFVFNQESSIILETRCEDVVKLFTDTFENDFLKSIPFLPTKEVITNSQAPLIDPASLQTILSYQFVTMASEPPTALTDSTLSINISNIIEADDAQFLLAMAGPNNVKFRLIDAINVLSSVSVAVPSLCHRDMADYILKAYQQNASTSVNLSYSLGSQEEANLSDVSAIGITRPPISFSVLQLVQNVSLSLLPRL